MPSPLLVPPRHLGEHTPLLRLELDTTRVGGCLDLRRRPGVPVWPVQEERRTVKEISHSLGGPGHPNMVRVPVWPVLGKQGGDYNILAHGKPLRGSLQA